LSKKLSACVGLLKRLASSKWGSDAKTLRVATLALINNAADYCAPVWCRSKHTCLDIDKPIHDALRLVTRCLRPTLINNLFVLEGITPTEPSLKNSYTVSSHLCNVPRSSTFSTIDFCSRELKSRHPFVPTALELLKDLNKSNTTAAFWADHK